MVYPTLKIHTHEVIGKTMGWRASQPPGRSVFTCFQSSAPQQAHTAHLLGACSKSAQEGPFFFRIVRREHHREPGVQCRWMRAWPPVWSAGWEPGPAKPQLESAASPEPVWAVCMTSMRRGKRQGRAEATAAHVPRETGTRGAHKHLGLPPAPSPPHCSHETYVCTHTRDVTPSPDTQ